MKASMALVCVGLAACATNSPPVYPPPDPASTPPASTLTRAQAPTFTVGEEWEYDFQSALDPAKNGRWKQAVVRTGDGRTDLEVSGGRAGSATLDANANYQRFGTAIYQPNDQHLSFPLFVGKSWSASYVYVNGDWRTQCEREAKVEAVERVETPAGVFEAFRIREKTMWQSGETYGGSGITRETLWYAPAAGRIIKSEYQDLPIKGASVSTRLVLLRHATPASDQQIHRPTTN